MKLNQIITRLLSASVMKQLLFGITLWCLYGCATLFATPLSTVSTVMSLGNIGQTLVKMTIFDTDGSKLAVGWAPRHYQENPSRMIDEAWEQNFRLLKKVSWRSEDLSWQEIIAATARKARGCGAQFAFVKRTPLGVAKENEEIFLPSPLGRPSNMPTLTNNDVVLPLQERSIRIPISTFTAYYFAPSNDPVGILPYNVQGPAPTPAPSKKGLIIRAIGKNTPANIAGLLHGDIIRQLNGVFVTENDDILSLLRPGANLCVITRNETMFSKTIIMPNPYVQQKHRGVRASDETKN